MLSDMQQNTMLGGMTVIGHATKYNVGKHKCYRTCNNIWAVTCSTMLPLIVSIHAVKISPLFKWASLLICFTFVSNYDISRVCSGWKENNLVSHSKLSSEIVVSTKQTYTKIYTHTYQRTHDANELNVCKFKRNVVKLHKRKSYICVHILRQFGNDRYCKFILRL